MKKERHSNPTALSPTWTSKLGLFYLVSIFGLAVFIFHPGLMDYTLLPRFALGSLVFIITAAVIIIKSFRNNILWPAMDLATGLLLSYFIWTTLSIFWAANFSEAIFESQKVMLGFAAFYFCRWFLLNDKSFVPRLLKGLTLLTIPVLLIAGWQIFQLDTNSDNALYEVRGISGHKNLYSTFLFLLCAFLSQAFLKLESKWRRAAAILSLMTLLLILYLKTRSVYLGLTSVVAIFAFWKIQQWLRPKVTTWLNNAVLILLILSILGFIYLWLSNQLLQLLPVAQIDSWWQSNTGYERINLWEKTACLVRQAPIWGIGVGNWQIEFPNCNVFGLYSVEVDLTTFQRPHNDWLWTWAETGIIGLFLYLGFFISSLKASWQTLKKEVLSSDQLALLVPMSFVVGFMLIACFSFPKERIELLLLSYTLIGLVYPQPSQPGRKANYLTTMLLVMIMMSASLNLYTSQKRMQGEKNMKAVKVLKQQSKWPEVISAADKAYSKWYTIDPTSIPIHWYRGTANFVLGNKELALQDFLKAQVYSPYNQHIQNDLGSCYQMLGQKEMARNHYKEAMRISPLFDDPRVNIAVSYFKDSNYTEALKWLNDLQNPDLKKKYQSIIEDQINNN